MHTFIAFNVVYMLSLKVLVWHTLDETQKFEHY